MITKSAATGISALRLGPYSLSAPVLLAPLAGWTDGPFRTRARSFGVGLAVTEMVLAQRQLWDTPKSAHRLNIEGESGLISLQIAGAQPEAMADAARFAVDRGAHIVDINMGCPAKKVAQRAAGSALLENEVLVGRILRSVVAAVNAPITLKIRTGTCPQNRNAVRIAQIAEAEGIQMLVIHGRTRACRFNGHAEHRTLSEVVASGIQIPVIANGDIASAQEARDLLHNSGASGVMIGRAALGQPWLPGQIAAELTGSAPVQAPSGHHLGQWIAEHLESLYCFYGEEKGVRIARKHWGWYAQRHAPDSVAQLKSEFNRLSCPQQQLQLVHRAFIQEKQAA